MSDLDAILDGLRGKAVPTIDEYTAEPDQPHVPLSDAVAAVHAAADTAREEERERACRQNGYVTIEAYDQLRKQIASAGQPCDYCGSFDKPLPNGLCPSCERPAREPGTA